MVNGVVVNYHEPPEAAKPTLRWRLYTFKNGEPLGDPLQVHRQSAYLFGREAKVADVRTDHPSCSKQHAVLQFRCVVFDAAVTSTRLAQEYRKDRSGWDARPLCATLLDGPGVYQRHVSQRGQGGASAVL